jgi:hypothetical protein
LATVKIIYNEVGTVKVKSFSTSSLKKCNSKRETVFKIFKKFMGCTFWSEELNVFGGKG